jgi:hypothetical protein
MSVITIEKVSYGITFPDLKFGNVRPGVVEATLKRGETMEDALDELDDRLNAWHRKRYPHLYQEIHDGFVQDANYKPSPSTQTTTTNSEPMVINLQHEKLEIEIDNCMCEDELKQWKAKHDILPGKIVAHYNNRLKELSV